MQWIFYGLSDRQQGVFSPPPPADRLLGPSNKIPTNYPISWGKAGQRLKLNTHLRLAHSLITRGPLEHLHPPLMSLSPLASYVYVFVAWCLVKLNTGRITLHLHGRAARHFSRYECACECVPACIWKFCYVGWTRGTVVTNAVYQTYDASSESMKQVLRQSIKHHVHRLS